MNQITYFEQRSIRILGTNEFPKFIAKDVCDLLGHSNSRKALEALDEDEKGVTIGYTLGGDQNLQYVTESGLYHLIFISRKPEAKTFRRWITEEVIPSIRKNGYDRTPPAKSPAELLALPAGRRDHVLLWQGIMEELAQASNRSEATREIQQRHAGQRGFSFRHIYNKFEKWAKANGDWTTLDRYRTRYKLAAPKE